jgi:hypothetical protein
VGSASGATQAQAEGAHSVSRPTSSLCLFMTILTMRPLPQIPFTRRATSTTTQRPRRSRVARAQRKQARIAGRLDALEAKLERANDNTKEARP